MLTMHRSILRRLRAAFFASRLHDRYQVGAGRAAGESRHRAELRRASAVIAGAGPRPPRRSFAL